MKWILNPKIDRRKVWAAFLLSAIVWFIFDYTATIHTVKRLSGYARKIGVPLSDVETAWWKFGYRHKYPDMFDWDADKFKKQFSVTRTANNLAPALITRILGK
jgi:hypothetical protein